MDGVMKLLVDFWAQYSVCQKKKTHKKQLPKAFATYILPTL
jgi:hypothetical protein